MRTGNVNSRELKKKFKCKQCECEIIAESDVTEYNQFKLPPKCGAQVMKKVGTNPFFKIA